MPVRTGEEETAGLSRKFFLLLAGLVLLLDQFSKALALKFLVLGTSRPVLAPLFHLTLVENQGIAFGLFQGFDKLLFVTVTVSIGVLVYLGFRSERWVNQWGMGLILGGAVGNWLDRVRVGAVIDFLDFRIWPVFNFADTAITLGVGLFLLDLLKGQKRVS